MENKRFFNLFQLIHILTTDFTDLKKIDSSKTTFKNNVTIHILHFPVCDRKPYHLISNPAKLFSVVVVR